MTVLIVNLPTTTRTLPTFIVDRVLVFNAEKLFSHNLLAACMIHADPLPVTPQPFPVICHRELIAASAEKLDFLSWRPPRGIRL
jgi:hypothetical protein